MPTILKDANIEAISLVDKGANLKRIFLYKRADQEQALEAAQAAATAVDELREGMVQPIIKAGAPGDEWSTIYCLVAVPGEVDQQGDVWEEDEIRKSAHNFVKGGGLINFMHDTLDPVGHLVESVIAPVDMTVNGEFIKKGSWYIAVEPNPEMKTLIKSGQVTGVSVQGSAQRVPVFTPGIDSPGTMLHTVTKNAARTLDGKAVKEGQRVHLANDVNQSYLVLGEDPNGSGKLVLGNAQGEHVLVHPLDVVTPQTAEAKLEQVAAEQPKPMAMQYNPNGESPFAGVYAQSEAAAAAQPEEQGLVKEARHPGTVTLDGQEGVWKTIRGGRAFIATGGERTGTILAGPDEIRGVSLEGLTKRTELLPSAFEQPIVKDANGRQLFRGDSVSHLLNPNMVMPVVEVLPQGVVVEVEKNGVMGQSVVPPRQVAYATGPVGGGGNFEDLVAALIGDFDENEQLQQALAQLGIQDKAQIEAAVQSGQLTEEHLRALLKLVDGPGDASDDANVEGTVAVRQGVANHMLKNDSSHSIDVLVNSLNQEAVVSEPVEKALPNHDPADCAVGGCPRCGKGASEGEVEKAAPFVCKCDCDKCADGVCGCTKGKACESCERDEEATAKLDAEKVEKGGDPFPGAAPPFGKKKPKEGEETGDEETLVAKADDEEDEGNRAFPGAAPPFKSKKAKDAESGVELNKHFVMGQPHEHPHQPVDKKKPARFPVAPKPEGAPAPQPGQPEGEAPAPQPEAQAAPQGAPAPQGPQGPQGPQLGDKPRPQLGRPKPRLGEEQPAQKAGFPASRTPDQPMGGKQPTMPGALGKPPAPGQEQAPTKPKLDEAQRATIVSELQQVAASGDKRLLAALQEMGVPADKLDALDIPDEQLIAMKEKFLTVGRTSQTPGASAPGFGVGSAKAEALVDRMTKAVAEREGWEQKPAALRGPKRLPAEGQNVVRGHGVRLSPDGALVKAGGDVEEGKVFTAPDGQRYIAKSVTDTTVVGFAGGEERSFPRGQVRVPTNAMRKRGEKTGARLPFVDGLLDEQAEPLAFQALVTVPGGALGTVYSVDGNDVVVIVDEEGNLPRRREYKRSQVKLKKSGLKAGDFVVGADGKAGEVLSVEGDVATLGYVTKDLREQTRTSPVADLKVIVAKSAAGGSMGGHSPKKHGKIKYIVRSFGEWAGGKQAIAAKRLLAEHPEVVGGDPRRANALAAWLKDQWAGTTKWRGKGKGLAKDATLIYEELDFEVDENWEPTPEMIDGVFRGFAELLGHDADEVEAVLATREPEAVDAYLDRLLAEEISGTATTSVETGATLDVSGPSPRRDDGAATGFARVREALQRALGDRQAGLAPTDREANLLSAFESLAAELESTAGEDDVLTKRQVVADFGRAIENL